MRKRKETVIHSLFYSPGASKQLVYGAAKGIGGATTGVAKGMGTATMSTVKGLGTATSGAVNFLGKPTSGMFKKSPGKPKDS